MAKPKIASDWLAGCSGCHMSLLDMDERILQVLELADLRSTPITDLKEPDATGVDVGILEGGINNTANEEVALRMRSRCKTLVALGDCAVFGGVPAMRNFFTIEESLRRAYIETESTDESGKIPSIRNWLFRQRSELSAKLSMLIFLCLAVRLTPIPFSTYWLNWLRDVNLN